MSELRKLAERCEAARADEQRDMLIAAFGVIFPTYYMSGRSGFVGTWRRFKKMLDAEAYESAAMALFPEGYFPVLDADPRHIEVEVQYLTDETDNGLGACVATGGKTIALALCAASLRARADGAGETKHWADYAREDHEASREAWAAREETVRQPRRPICEGLEDEPPHWDGHIG